MRILHINDQAGVGCILAKYQQSHGHQARVIVVSEYDKYGIHKFYDSYVLRATLPEFLPRCIEYAHSADILHIHSRIDMVFELRKQFGNSKKIILHYHGTDIRGLKKHKLPHRSKISDLAIRSIFTYRSIRDRVLLRKRLHSKAQRLADAVIVSTPDLLELVPQAQYIPNPIDIEHFKPDRTLKKEPKEALAIDTEVTNTQWTLDYCRKNNINLNIDVYNRIKEPITYAEMPAFLKKYKIYVDIRYVNNRILENLSKTALEALACGLQVLDYRLRYQQGLPAEFDPAKVGSRVSTVYSS